MTKTKDSPPEEDGSGEILDASSPMWGELVRLLGDEESGHTIHLQLKTAIKSQVIEAALSEDRLTRHVGRTSASVAEVRGRKKRQISVPRGGLGKKSLPPKNWPCKAQLRPI